jgi:hypothetical protein
MKNLKTLISYLQGIYRYCFLRRVQIYSVWKRADVEEPNWNFVLVEEVSNGFIIYSEMENISENSYHLAYHTVPLNTFLSIFTPVEYKDY